MLLQTKEGMSPTNLAELLQLATDVKRSNKLHRAIHLARKRKVFITMSVYTLLYMTVCVDVYTMYMYMY